MLPEERELKIKLARQDVQLASIKEAEAQYTIDNDMDSLIAFWEQIWKNGGLLFNGSKWTFRLPDLYIKVNRYDDALKILSKIKSKAYSDKVKSYREKINKLKIKAAKSASSKK